MVALALAPLARRWGAHDPTPAAGPVAVSSGNRHAPLWLDVAPQFQTFGLSGGAYAKLPLRYEAQRDQDGADRADRLTFGSAQAGQPWLRIVFTQTRSDPLAPTSLFLDEARLAGDLGFSVRRSAPTPPLQTRFGPFETGDVVLDEDGRATSCRAFRRRAGTLAVFGLLCGAVDRTVTLPLACTLDKLDLLSAGNEAALRDLFAAAERQRGLGCVEAHNSVNLPTNTMPASGGS